MNPNLTLSVLAGVLFGSGVVLLLSRSLVRALLGVLLMGNGVNVVYIVASGPAGRAPIVSKEEAAAGVPIGADGISDPLPQAMVLTAIVITLAVTGFVLALAHRQWQLAATDVVANDPEDERISLLAEANDLSGSDYTDTADPHALADDAEEAPPADPVVEEFPDELPAEVIEAERSSEELVDAGPEDEGEQGTGPEDEQGTDTEDQEGRR
ncbi:Na(+)/H(+) antiporter subunit C [Luteococcus peritonei]|uniref:Na(+)/H(+) antiporter subunit C n=1 Tax=Luteococcus peritonei TaxID=88874 RepID=A0ABW4RXJ5_9ACTN